MLYALTSRLDSEYLSTLVLYNVTKNMKTTMITNVLANSELEHCRLKYILNFIKYVGSEMCF